MEKNNVFRRYVLFLIGLFINSFGVAFITKASLGTSPISSVPYVLSLGFPFTLGQFTVVFNVLLVLMQVALLRKKFPLRDLLQIPVVGLFGFFIDVSMVILGGMNPEIYPIKIALLLVGCAILALGVYTEVAANVVMLPGEAFVRAVTIVFHTDFGITKVCFDVSCSVAAIIISLAVFSGVQGVREGTVIAAVIVGLISKVWGKILSPVVDRWLNGADLPKDAYESVSND